MSIVVVPAQKLLYGPTLRFAFYSDIFFGISSVTERFFVSIFRQALLWPPKIVLFYHPLLPKLKHRLSYFTNHRGEQKHIQLAEFRQLCTSRNLNVSLCHEDVIDVVCLFTFRFFCAFLFYSVERVFLARAIS